MLRPERPDRLDLQISRDWRRRVFIRARPSEPSLANGTTRRTSRTKKDKPAAGPLAPNGGFQLVDDNEAGVSQGGFELVEDSDEIIELN